MKKFIKDVFRITLSYLLVDLLHHSVENKNRYTWIYKRIQCVIFGHYASLQEKPIALNLIKRKGDFLALATFTCVRCGCIEKEIMPAKFCIIPLRIQKLLDEEEGTEGLN